MDRKKRTVYIPPDYKNRINLFIKSYPLSNVIQGLIVGLIPLVIIWYILPWFINLSGSKKFSLSIFFCVIFMFIGCEGINGGTLLDYFVELFKFLKNRRTAYYNPRIKVESKQQIFGDTSSRDMLPFEKMQEMYSQWQVKNREKHQQNVVNNKNESSDELYFEDDIGVVDTPWEYMTKKERKKEIKEAKKMARIERRKAKKNARIKKRKA